MKTTFSMHIIGIVLFIIVSCSVAHAGENESYRFAVVPQYPKLFIHRSWTPLLNYIQEKTGIELRLELYNNITEFSAEVEKGIPDFAYMNPYTVLRAKNAQGYIPLIRDDSKNLEGIIVVHKDSDIKSIEELQDKKVAFPSPNAFAASLYIRALLAEKKIEIIPEYVTTHANVYRHVILNKVSGGGGIYRTLEHEAGAVRSQVRVIFTTPGTPAHPISAHPRVPLKIQRAVHDAFIALANDHAKHHLLDAVQISQPVSAAYERDYQPLEKLHLDHFASKTEN